MRLENVGELMSNNSNHGLLEAFKPIAIFLAVVVLGYTIFGNIDSLSAELGRMVVGLIYMGIFIYACVIINRILFNRKCYQSAIASDNVFYTHLDLWSGKKGMECTYHRSLTEDEERKFYEIY